MHLRSVVRAWYPNLYARHIRSRGVATDHSPVTTRRVVAYALCSKNVVRVNEAKLTWRFRAPRTFYLLRGSTPTNPSPTPPPPPPPPSSLLPSFSLLSQSIASNCSPEATLAFPRTQCTREESLKSANNVKIGV